MKNQKGFSLIELLVVVIIIGIVAAIAIPSLLSSRRAANEASAIASVRTIGTGQATYYSTTGAGAYSANLATLSGIIDANLADGGKSGYTFATTAGTGIFCVTGSPSGTQGIRHFGMDEDMSVYGDATAFTCAAGDLTEKGTAVGD